MEDEEKEEHMFMFPEPTSEFIIKSILINSKNPGSICNAADKLEETKTKELNDCVKAEDWDCSSKVLDELKISDRLRYVCKSYPK